MELTIRRMESRDIDNVVEIEHLSFPVPWSRDSFVQELRNPLALYVVVEEGPEIQAYIGVWIIFDEGHITNVAVHPRARGRAIGEMLMEKIIEILTLQGLVWLTLEVRPSNSIALNLYQRLGFIQVGVRKGYYSDNGEDAIIMTLKLAEPAGIGEGIQTEGPGGNSQ